MPHRTLVPYALEHPDDDTGHRYHAICRWITDVTLLKDGEVVGHLPARRDHTVPPGHIEGDVEGIQQHWGSLCGPGAVVVFIPLAAVLISSSVTSLSNGEGMCCIPLSTRSRMCCSNSSGGSGDCGGIVGPVHDGTGPSDMTSE